MIFKSKNHIVACFIVLTFMPVAAKANSSDFSGGVAVGSGYAGVNTAPTDGLIVQGNVGIGTASPTSTLDINGTANANSLKISGVPVPIMPGGRLTLSSTAPVMASDTVNATTIYYLPYQGQNIPIFNGTNWTEQDIGSSGLSLTLNTTNMPTTKVFDVYASMQSGSLTLCSLYWGNNITRSTTAGGKSGTQNASIVRLNGFWVNNAAISTSNCYNDTTSYSISANQGILLGSLYTNVAGATTINIKPSPAAGGSGNVVGISNAYNRVHISSIETDSNLTWSYATASWQAADNSSKNSVTFLDCLQQSIIETHSESSVVALVAGNGLTWGQNLDSTTAAPIELMFHAFPTNIQNNNYGEVETSEIFPPQLGVHFIQAMQFANTGTVYFNAAAAASHPQYALIVGLEY